jgi:hypothetical protein
VNSIFARGSSAAAAPTDIIEFGVKAPDSWYPIPLDDRSEKSAWAHDLAGSIASGDEAARVTARIDDIRYRLTMQGNPFLSAAVYLPRAASGLVDCVLTYQLSDLDEGGSPESFIADAEAQRGRREPGFSVRDVTTWRRAIPAGELAGARTLNAYQELGAETGWVEERTVFAVFPPGALQSVQFSFTTSMLDAFVDMPAETEAVVETLTVRLGK